MQKPQRSQRYLVLYSAFVLIIAILLLGQTLSSPSEPGNSLFLGLSAPRLVLAGGFLAAALLSAFLILKTVTDLSGADELLARWFGDSRLSRAIAAAAAMGLGLGFAGCFLPAYRAGVLAVHWDRLRPVMVFLLLVSLATLLLAYLYRYRAFLSDTTVARSFRASLLWFLPSLLLLGVMLATDFGVYAREDFWYGAGVPILVTQLLAALTGGLLFLQAEKKWGMRRLDLLVLVLIYALTAFLWAREPLQKSFLFIGPYAPNRALYPFADAALFDTASQFALIGENFRFFNGQFFERALYVSFLVYLHSLVGQDYARLMAAQAALFAVFPPLVYLIGRSLHARPIGFAAALIAMFRGANAIAASNMIDMANPKMMLTDFPTAIGMALVVYLACEWLRSPSQRWHYALWIGGVLGTGIMLRTNTLVVLLLMPLYSLLALWPKRKAWLTSSLLLVLAVFVVTLPWELRNQSLGGTMYESFYIKFRSVIDQRYTPPPESSGIAPAQDPVSRLTFKQIHLLHELGAPAAASQIGSACDRTACFIPAHFLHNVLTSVLVLPTGLMLDDLRYAVRERFDYWRPDWDGSFTTAALFFFLLNVFLMVLGIVSAWHQHRWTGLVPLMVFVFYHVSNGLARTSGGRYIVPVDWVLTIYYLIGLFQTIILFASRRGVDWKLFSTLAEPAPPRLAGFRNRTAAAFVVLAVLFGAGSLVPLAEKLYPERYRSSDVSGILLGYEQEIVRAGLSLPEIEAFLQSPGAEISVGRALYPRYYVENQGEVHFHPVVVMGFPRMTFTLIGREGEKGIVLPGEKPAHFPHAVDTLVLGCREQRYVDALAVILLDGSAAVYTRSPASPLQCPLKQPVCDNNHNCY